MSGWENLPKQKPAPARTAASGAGEAAPPDANQLITDGDLIRAAEWYFPTLWIAMLAVVAFIGIYSAVGKLPNSPW